MSYIGQGLPADVFAGFTIDKFTGTGVASQALTLTKAPLGETALLITIDGVVQEPTDDFTVSGTTVTIVGTAPLNSEINVTHLSGTVPNTLASAVDVNGLSDGIILDADADTTISADTDDQIDFKTGGTDRLTIQSTSGNNVVVADGLTLTDGNLVVASGHGIDFSATSDGTTMSSELFDDYETGSFTPTLLTSSNTAGNAQSTGTYIKVGDMVYASGWVILNNATSFDGIASRTLRISLPFTAVNTSLLYQGSWSIPYYADITLDSGYYGLGGYSVNNEALIRIMQNGGAGVFALKEGKLDNDGFTFMFGGCFRVV